MLLSTAGCGFYFGDDDCVEADRFPVPDLRNPETGRCESQGTVGGGCGGDPAPLPGTETPPSSGDQAGPGFGGGGAEAPIDPSQFDWAQCNTFCDNLAEDQCKLADGCRAAYRELPFDGIEFIGCWGTAPSGPIRGTDCTQAFSGYECSLHDDCSPVYLNGPGAEWGPFTRCIPESDCPGGGVPQPLFRDPVTGQCTDGGVGCGAIDPPVVPDLALCVSGCEAFDEATCRGVDGCRAIYVDACPACDALVLEFAACWGVPPSGPIRGGDCGVLDAQECSRHDDCTAVHANDWTISPMGPPWTPAAFGWCAAEVVPPPACDTITDERTCIERVDCSPVYEGSDCTCDASGCTCATWTFIACQQG